MANLALKVKRQQERGKGRDDLPKTKELAHGEKYALAKLRKEAAAKGAFLATGGKGGLPPSMVLGAFRRAGYRCEQADEKNAPCADSNGMGNEENGLTVHHKGGIPSTPKLNKLGHRLTKENLQVLCEKHHDQDHERARAQGIDSSQVTPAGDEGTSRDHGKPPAHPKGGDA